MSFILVALTGCERYRAAPLDPSSVLMNVEKARRFVDERETSNSSEAVPPFTFTRAVELMRKNSPALKETFAQFQTALAPAGIKTPLPNPSVEAGPQIGWGPDVSPANKITPFGSIGFAIPTGKRLKRQDELNGARADAAKAECAIRARELYLELRLKYSQFLLAHERLIAKRQIAESAQKSTALTKRLIEAGNATALDSGLIELEQIRLKSEALNSEVALSEIQRELSRLIGVHADHFAVLPEKNAPALPSKTADIAALRDLLVNNHPALARLRTQYEIAERELRLEIAKQYPDFRVGPSFDRDVGDRKNVLGLTLGIDLPIFDRNQQAVATALKHREEIRAKFEAEANRALADLDHALRVVEISNEKLALIKNVLQPKANANMDLAKRSVEAGATDTLRFLETERGQRSVMIDALESEFSVREAWIALEQAVGFPLFEFPGESRDDYPTSEELERPTPTLAPEVKQ